MTGVSGGGSGVGNDGPTAGELGGIGFTFAAAILLFVFAGRWADARFGTGPWLLIVGVFLGAGSGFYFMYTRLMAIQARDDERKRQRSGVAS